MNEQWKNMIDLFIKDEIKNLEKISIRNSIGHQWDWRDLLSELIEYLYTKEDKVSPFIDSNTSLIRYCNQWLYNQTKLFESNRRSTNFKGKFQIIDYSKGVELDISYTQQMISSDEEKDLRTIYNDSQVEKILFTKQICKKLDESEKTLYNLHFEKGLSHYRIAEHLKTKWGIKTSPSSVYNLLVKLRTKIKKEYDNRN